MSNDLARMTASSLSRLFATGQVSPVEATKAVIIQIESLNPHINAFCWLDTFGALQAAQDSEARWRKGTQRGPLDGVTFTVKDLSLTRGMPTRRGSSVIAAAGRWDEDAPSVARMREAGGILLGKTTVPEFGTSSATVSALCGITRNPWDLRISPGGSSGGAAASVMAGMGTIALASDAAGSIRGPASMTGAFGLKPTFGRVPDYPSSYLGSIAVVGPITRSVEDTALCMDAISKPDSRDPHGLPLERPRSHEPTPSLKGVRILFSPTFGYAMVDPEIEEIVRAAALRFQALGAQVEERDHVIDDPADCIWTIMAAGMANAARIFGWSETQLAQMTPRMRESIARGSAMGVVELLAAHEQRVLLSAQMRRLNEDFDLLLSPALAIPSSPADNERNPDPRYAGIANAAPFGYPFNLTNQPAASLPVGLTADGVPVGMQVVGSIYGDRLVLRACEAFEQAYPFAVPDLSRIARDPPFKPIPQGIQSMLDALPY